MVLLSKLALPRLNSLLMQHQVVDFRVHLDGQLLHLLYDLRIGLLEERNLVPLVTAMDNTLGANGCRVAVEAEVLHLLLGVLLAELA